MAGPTPRPGRQRAPVPAVAGPTPRPGRPRAPVPAVAGPSAAGPAAGAGAGSTFAVDGSRPEPADATLARSGNGSRGAFSGLPVGDSSTRTGGDSGPGTIGGRGRAAARDSQSLRGLRAADSAEAHRGRAGGVEKVLTG